jgi:hypothetical protein
MGPVYSFVQGSLCFVEEKYYKSKIKIA